MTAIADILQAPTITWPLPTSFAPRPFQLTGVDRGAQGNLVFDIGLGGGKTTMALATAEQLAAQRVLVLCPAKVIAVWRDEVAENAARHWDVWSGRVNGARGPLKNPSVARRVEAIIQADSAARRLGRPFMAVVNYEAIPQRQMFELLHGTQWDMLIVDESHKIAAAGGKISFKISRVAKRVRAHGGRVLLLTGTLMPHSGLSLYGQFRTLDPAVLGSSWTNFKARYAKWRVLREVTTCARCKQTLHLTSPDVTLGHCPSCGPVEVLRDPIYHRTPKGEPIPDGVKPEVEDELMRRVAPYVLRVSQEELDAQTGLHEPPPQLRTTKLSDETRRVYDRLEKDLIARVRSGVITSANAMVNVLRLAQVTSGYGTDADTGNTIALADPPEKAALLADELADIDVREPVVVFARFHHDLDQIHRVATEQGRRYGEISGRRSDGLDGHLMSSEVDVVGVQPQSGGAGINLSRARLGIFYSVDFNLANYLQCKRRILRQGQTRHVTYLHLVVEDSIDVATFYALKRRHDVIEALLAHLSPTERTRP